MNPQKTKKTSKLEQASTQFQKINAADLKNAIGGSVIRGTLILTWKQDDGL